MNLTTNTYNVGGKTYTVGDTVETTFAQQKIIKEILKQRELVKASFENLYTQCLFGEDKGIDVVESFIQEYQGGKMEISHLVLQLSRSLRISLGGFVPTDINPEGEVIVRELFPEEDLTVDQARVEGLLEIPGVYGPLLSILSDMGMEEVTLDTEKSIETTSVIFSATTTFEEGAINSIDLTSEDVLSDETVLSLTRQYVDEASKDMTYPFIVLGVTGDKAVITAMSPMRATKVATNNLVRSLYNWMEISEGDKGFVALLYSEMTAGTPATDEVEAVPPVRLYNTAIVDVTDPNGRSMAMLQHELEDGELRLVNRILGPEQLAEAKTPEAVPAETAA